MFRDIVKRALSRGLCVALFVSFGATSLRAEPVRHYELSWSRDLQLTVFAALSSVYGNYRYSQMDVVSDENLVDKSRLLPWDRPVAGRYDGVADKVSDWAAVLGVAPLALAGYSWYGGDATGYDFAAYTLMFAQSLALQNGLDLLVRSTQLWPRPYIYATEGEGAEKAREARGEAYGSFFSGHASAAFSIAVFTGEWFSEVYPNSPYKGIVWASALSAAGMVGVLRIAAGKHYPTDVVVGALAGTGISLSVIRLHKAKNERVSLVAGPNTLGVAVKF